MFAARRSRAGLAAFALVLSLALLGARGIWDPDEGRYSNVALLMLDSGDWLNPQRSLETGHWTKPPLAYWASAASLSAFGRNAWAARLPSAMSYLLCVWLCARIGRRLLPEGPAEDAPWLYACMALAVGAAQFLSIDYLLAACETLAMAGYVQARFGAARPRAWLALFWGALGLAFLAKGPPGLVPLVPVLACELLLPGNRRPALLQWWALPLFALVALPWYVAAGLRNPGLLEHLLGREVVSRVASEDFNRHGQWYGWLAIYVPTLLVGSLPWTGALWRWVRALPARMRAWRDADARAQDAAGVLLAAWVLLPLLLFCVSRSRMPLYLLPLFVPLALLAARARRQAGRGAPSPLGLAGWAALLLALQLAAAHWSTHKDAAGWAQAIRARTQAPVAHVVFVEDMARYGLHLELGAPVDKLSLLPQRQARFNPEYDADIAALLPLRNGADSIWIAKRGRWDAVIARLRALGMQPVALGASYEGRVIFRLQPLPAPGAPAPG